jgi:hypothetical protein
MLMGWNWTTFTNSKLLFDTYVVYVSDLFASWYNVGSGPKWSHLSKDGVKAANVCVY